MRMLAWKFIETTKLSKDAQIYFGGNAYSYEFIKRAPRDFIIRQTPEKGRMITRLVGFSSGPTQRDAIRHFNEVADASVYKFYEEAVR